ncbi:HAD family hydrolase [Deinococcus ruber]|uniref:HAD family hydrolase n=1 Tax=Deinococcus ruber TaxID=1848197 RepID=A0A918C0B3_9DEIO|nr:HAD family hydrolase [Deinococcus ruber]GGQ99288.1 hypothetical protein GCM10008957_10030 [Deinococcus ruber]
MSGPLRAVLFDLDGTLHDRAESIRRYLKGHARRFELPAGYAERFTVLDDLGYRSKQEVAAELVAEFGLSHTPAELFQDYSDHAWSDVARMPHALEVLTELRRRGVRLGIVTNGWTEKQQECIRGLDLAQRVDDVIVSEAVGLKKPDPAIFHLALSRLGVAAQDAWYVGDSPVNDVAGPQAAGLQAALLPGGHPLPPTLRPDVLLQDLRGVLEL